jgi:hypothetical protein
MKFNYSKLFVRVKERYVTIKRFADAMDLTRVQMSYKLNNQSSWSQRDIVKAMDLLAIDKAQTYDYFLEAAKE